jgi:membrane fusion protein (multidrug efflux system)
MPDLSMPLILRLLFMLLFLHTLLGLGGCNDKKNVAKQAGPPPGVLVQKIARKEIENNVQYIGRTTAINDVALKAQVSGYLLETLFTEGSDVEKDDELFIIEPDLYLANAAAAQANLAKAEADQMRAEKDLARYKLLLKTKNISQQQVDVTQSEVLQTEAQVKIARAELQKADLDLSYTHIRAPIKGRIGRTVISVGNVIGPQTEMLARIVELDPIYVTFNIAEADLIKVKRDNMSKYRELSSLPNPERIRKTDIKIKLILPDKSEYDETGTVDFVDNTVDPRTGTVVVRASFPNPDSLLVPGLYVRTILFGGKKQSQLLVHASAVQEDQAGRFVMVVDHENKVDMRRIKTGRQFGGDLVVLEGLYPDEMVVVEGIQKVRPGMIVDPRIAVLPGDEDAEKNDPDDNTTQKDQ